VAIGVVVALAGVVGIAASLGGSNGAPAAVASPTPEPTATPTVEPVSLYPAPAPIEEPLAVPFGPVKAEPYRVHTGDGDCLNVRPTPGLTFASDPRTCVPEGFLLWMYGEPTDVDGHTWRYAVGEGWVAVEYIQPATGATAGFGPFQAVTVGAQAGQVTKLAKVTREGLVASLPTLPDAMQGLGDQPPTLSPDGKWAAYGAQDGYVPTLTVRNMVTGLEQKYPQVNPDRWSATNRLLVRVNANCPKQCTWTVGWLDPREGLVHTFNNKQNEWWNLVWAPDGESIYVVDGGALKQVTLDGEERVIVAKESEEIPWGQLSISPDGKKLLSSPFQGAIVVVDLATGRVSKVPRAPQIPVGGRCGGSVGSLTTWLDNETVIWHESYAEKGGNGITIARIDGGARKLIPFFTVSDIRAVAPGLVSFTTAEQSADGKGYQLSWLLDTDTLEARPVTVGASPAWQ
jgi:hypothetical protein